PSRDGCGSCHDGINWETGEGHVAGPATDDSQCVNCHQPEGDAEFDASVMGSHVIPTKSTQLAGLNAEILSTSGTAPGENPSVTFRLTDNDGSVIPPADLDRLRFLIAGPAEEYATYFREDAQTAAFDGDTATYTFETPIPEDATGTWSVSADIYRNVTVKDAQDEDISVREAAFNPLLDFPVTDLSPIGRREVVNQDSCNNCHDVLTLHGSQRFNIDECVMCHTPEGTDAAVRPPEAGEPESIHFKYLIHRLHKGHYLENDFTVYGFRSSVHNYNNLLYPGDLSNCEACHLPGTYSFPTPDEARATVTPRDWYTPMLPGASACLSCHDSQQAAAHAFVNTAPFGEGCAACHGPDRAFSVKKSHAR
ncbi:MAG: OmcA/MtrC family decaheme c-type cytochrome, partial [Acidobacteriota bacterium]|nr:OmcA/MtrC family decaheme c-type cytochrome [Acidobacteriota bacterium]